MNEAIKQVNRIQANAHKFKQPSKPVEDNNHPVVMQTIDDLFARLKAITSVGNAFKTEREEHIVKQEWILAFNSEGIKNQHVIDDGVEAIRVKARKNRGTTWFPSIGEFVDACLGSDNKLEAAERAYRIFSNPKWQEKQICNIGQMVVSGYSFELRQLNASDCKNRFIELYLEFAKYNEIEPLDAFVLTDGVKLSPEQEKAAQKRSASAQADFLQKFGGIVNEKPKEKVNPVKTGLVTGKIKTPYKSPAQLEKEKERQLALIKNMEK